MEQRLLIFKENVLGFTGFSSVLNVGRDTFLNTSLSSAEQHCNCYTVITGASWIQELLEESFEVTTGAWWQQIYQG